MPRRELLFLGSVLREHSGRCKPTAWAVSTRSLARPFVCGGRLDEVCRRLLPVRSPSLIHTLPSCLLCVRVCACVCVLHVCLPYAIGGGTYTTYPVTHTPRHTYTRTPPHRHVPLPFATDQGLRG